MALNDADRKVVNAAALVIKAAVEEGEKVMIRDFGTFSMKDRAARTARNPKTGEAVQVPAKTVLVFKASKKA